MIKKCKMCKKEIEKHRTYCSNECKFSDHDYNMSRTPTIKNDPLKAIRHRETGKIYKDENNLSGALSRYSEEVLGRPFDWYEWEVFDIEPDKTIECRECAWTTKDVNNKSGMLTIHIKKEHPEITLEGYWTKHPYQKHLFKKQIDKVKKQKERDRVGLECKECGKFLKKITVTHLRTHNMTPQQYREKHGVYNLSCDQTRKKLSKNYYELNLMSDSSFTSNKEKEILNFLKELGVEVKPTYRKLGVELDMYLPNYNIAIEFNGLYWHSEKSSGKDKNYHISKTTLCESKNIKLIHIFEDEWVYKKDIVKSRLKSFLGFSPIKIYARKCEVKEVEPKVKNQFLEENHIQGKDVSKIKLGLYYNNRLISLMTFSDFRKSMGRDKQKGCYELSRFCSKINTVVIGGASKLLKYFEKNYNPKIIISYADRRWTSNNDFTLYDTLGFEKKGVTKPSYWYMKRHQERIHRYVFAKHKIIERFENADPNLSEWENMKNLGFDRIWDCGTVKYEKKL